MKKQKKIFCGYSYNKGVTLTVLVITIIVLLILAGVALLAVVGENGVINRSQTAAQKQKHKSTEEQICSDIAYNTETGEVDLSATIANINKNKSNYALGIKSITPSTITNNIDKLIIELEDGYKILIDINGNVIADYKPSSKPDSEEVIADDDLIYMKNEFEGKSIINSNIFLPSYPPTFTNESVSSLFQLSEWELVCEYNNKYYTITVDEKGSEENGDYDIYVSSVKSYNYVGDKNDYFIANVENNKMVIYGLTDLGKTDIASNKKLVIPKNITGKDNNEYKVRKIAMAAFLSNTDIETVEFAPDIELEEIGDSAFSNTNFASITIPKSVKTFGTDVFRESGVVTVEFESGSLLQEIPRDTFEGCPNIDSITIPKNVKLLGNDAFRDSGLKSLKFESGSRLEEIEYGVCLDCPNLTGTITIPKSVKKIGGHAFKNCNLTGFEFETGSVIETIEWEIYLGCENLTGIVEIPSSINELDRSAFASNSGESITVKINKTKEQIKNMENYPFGAYMLVDKDNQFCIEYGWEID